MALRKNGYGCLRALSDEDAGEPLVDVEEILPLLGIDTSSPDRFIESLPFSLNDTTAGTENELQTAVVGRRQHVDLPITIERSNFYSNIVRRANSGDTPRNVLTGIEAYLHGNSERTWENSWVRFPTSTLSPLAREVLEGDLLADKRDPSLGYRKDVDRFLFQERGEQMLRIPVSYLIKLSLADVLGSRRDLTEPVVETGTKLLNHFSNDNTSPETSSFHVVPLRTDSGMGNAIASETSKRFLLTQLLTMYANLQFRLRANGQHTVIYSAPHPPVRQRELNGCISDAFYREIFMSPCLSGWDEGEAKHSYMCLCHQVLSRSQLNALGKLREAGILTRNLVVLPNMSNVSLANNGVHLSLGSLKLTRLMKDDSSRFTRKHEKYLGDLAIKIAEHFLPLFVGTYSAAPYRMDFSGFHPETALGFLPHELDYTHLRMLWRRWKKKADLKIFGHPVTPFGPEWLDRSVGGLFHLKGDFIPDFRLIDYFAALLSTDRSSALDGSAGSGDRLKRDLAELGIYDRKMALYMLYRLREFDTMGFTGFEGRHYSLFESNTEDLARAANLQTLVNALAFKYIAKCGFKHSHIPDSPSIESERRQIFFGTAIGIPTFFIRKGTPNLFLQNIVEKCGNVRESRRYPGYLRVYNIEYRKALVRLLREDAADLIEMLQLEETIDDLMLRLENPDEYSAGGKLTRSILDSLNVRDPMQVDAREFNRAAEYHYRNSLRVRHIEEAFDFLKEDAGTLDSRQPESNRHTSLRGRSALEFVSSVERDILEETATVDELKTLVDVLLLAIRHDILRAERTLDDPTDDTHTPPSIRRAAHW